MRSPHCSLARPFGAGPRASGHTFAAQTQTTSNHPSKLQTSRHGRARAEHGAGATLEVESEVGDRCRPSFKTITITASLANNLRNRF